jgi:hypothetical protein
MCFDDGSFGWNVGSCSNGGACIKGEDHECIGGMECASLTGLRTKSALITPYDVIRDAGRMSET